MENTLLLETNFRLLKERQALTNIVCNLQDVKDCSVRMRILVERCEKGKEKLPASGWMAAGNNNARIS